MLQNVYCIRDSVSGLYNNPTIEQNDNVAHRSFKFAVNNNDFLNFNAHDVDLFCIGQFDNETGELISEAPRKVTDGVSVLERK